MSKNLGKNMMIYSGVWQGQQTFRLMPSSLDCPYMEGLFDPINKVLVIITKAVATKLHKIEKLDNSGHSYQDRKTGKTAMKEVMFETPIEHYFHNKNEILNFLDLFTINLQDHDVDKYFTVEEKKKSVITEK